MTSFKKWLSDSACKYVSAKSILSAELKVCVNPEEQGSVEEAEAIFQDLLKEMERKYKEGDNTQVLAVRAQLKYDIECIQLLNEDFDLGIATLCESWELIKEVSRDPEYCFLALSILNHISKQFQSKNLYEKCVSFLKEAECLYLDYKANSNSCPRNPEDLFSPDSERKECWDSFEIGYSTSLYDFAKTYELLGDVENAAKYSEMFLSRCKGFIEFDAVDWAFKAASLSNLYLMQKDYLRARHILSCANYINSFDRVSFEGRPWILMHMLATNSFISLCWAIYFQSFLSDIKKNTLEPKMQQTPPRLLEDIDLEDEILELEEKAPLSVTTLEEAENLFLVAENRVENAKAFHTFSRDPKNYILLEHFHCELYEFLIKFKNDLGEVFEMHEKRAVILERVLSQISYPTYPADWENTQVLLGSIYGTMVHIKLDLLKTIPNNRKQAAINKIKELLNKSTGCFERFLECLKDPSGEFPNDLADHFIRNFIMLHDIVREMNRQISLLDPSYTGNTNNLDECFEFMLEYITNNYDRLHHILKDFPDFVIAFLEH